MNWQAENAWVEQFVGIALQTSAIATVMLAIAIIVAYRLRPRLRQSLLTATLFGLGLCPILVGTARVFSISIASFPLMTADWAKPASTITLDEFTHSNERRDPFEHGGQLKNDNMLASLKTALSTSHREDTTATANAIDRQPTLTATGPKSTIDAKSIWTLTLESVFGVWLAGVTFFLVRLVLGWLWVKRLVLLSSPIDLNEKRESLDIVKAEFAPRPLPRIRESSCIHVPVAVGVLRPAVILPQGMAGRIAEDELAALLIHECAHVMRRDCLMGIVQKIVEATYWFHPLVYSMNRLIARTREEICDNYVLKRMPAKSYATMLLKLAETVSTSTAIAAIPLLSRGWKLEDRVKGLFDSDRIQDFRSGRTQRAVWPAGMILLLLALSLTQFVTSQNTSKTFAAIEPQVGKAEPIAPQGEQLAMYPTRRIMFSPNGELVAACYGEIGKPGLFRVWSWRTGKQIIERKEEAGIVDCSFSPNGSTIAIGMFDKVAKLLSLETGEQLLEFTGHQSHVRNVAFVNSHTLATGSYDKTVRLWEVDSGRQIALLGEHEKELRSIAASPDGRYLLTGATSPDCRLWSVGDQKQVAVFRESDLICPNVCFSRDGQYFLSARWDAKVRIRETETQKLRAALTIYSVRGMDLSPDNRILITCTDQSELLNMLPVRLDSPSAAETARILDLIKLWNSDDFQIREKASEELISMGIVIEPYLRSIMNFDSAELRIRARRARAAVFSPKIVDVDVGHNANVGAVAFAPDNVHVASGDAEGNVKIWRIADRKVVVDFPIAQKP